MADLTQVAMELRDKNARVMLLVKGLRNLEGGGMGMEARAFVERLRGGLEAMSEQLLRTAGGLEAIVAGGWPDLPHVGEVPAEIALEIANEGVETAVAVGIFKPTLAATVIVTIGPEEPKVA